MIFGLAACGLSIGLAIHRPCDWVNYINAGTGFVLFLTGRSRLSVYRLSQEHRRGIERIAKACGFPPDCIVELAVAEYLAECQMVEDLRNKIARDLADPNDRPLHP